MSYILDALKKSEQERMAATNTEAVAPSAMPRAATRSPIVITLALVVAIAVLSAWYFVPDPNGGNAAESTAPPTPAADTGNRYDLADALPVPAPTAPAPPAIKPRPPAPSVSTASPARVPYLREMPDEFQHQLPQLTIDIHVFTPGGQSILYINGREHGAGETITTGLRVEAIVPEGAILSYQGQRFRLPRPNR